MGNNSQGLVMSDVRQISLQLLKSLEMLHSIGLVHCDLKCRNVMLRDAAYDLVSHPRVPEAQTRKLRDPSITIIDFGGAVFEEDRHNGRIGTRQFRAPEVVLGLHWSEKADMWSAGCIIIMLYLGQRIFSMHEDMEFFAICQKALGTSLPSAMVASALEEGQLEGMTFGKDADGQWVSAWPGCAPDQEAIRRVEAIVPLRERVCERHANFLSLVENLLAMDPERRWAASRCCQCQFFADHDEPQE